MIESEFDAISSGFSRVGARTFTDTAPLLDQALALAFAPAGRGGGGDATRPATDRSPSFQPLVPDRYQIIEPIAHGGQGVIIRVWDTNLGRELALKTIHADPTGEEQARARLETEARVLASLEHPGVPPV